MEKAEVFSHRKITHVNERYFRPEVNENINSSSHMIDYGYLESIEPGHDGEKTQPGCFPFASPVDDFE